MRETLTAAREALENVIRNTHSHRDLSFADSCWHAANEALAQLRAAEAESGWRPIAEAPKDTAIMVYVNGFKIAHYNIRLGKWIGYGLETSDTILMSRDPPTHWQPLPAPPAKEGK